MARQRLLFISPRFLFPANEGGKIRTSNILRCLKGGAFEITFASPAPANQQDYADSTNSVCDKFVSWPASEQKPFLRLAALASRLPVSVAMDRSDAGRQTVRNAIASGTDLVVTDFPHADVLLPDLARPPCVLFTHNVEAQIYERHAKIATGIRRLVWENQARKMAAFEGAVCRKHDAVIAVSAQDANLLKRRYGIKPPREIVTGIDIDFFSRTPQNAVDASGGTVVFTGVMDSPANIDGVSYFLREVWPLIVKDRPSARTIIVGRNPPDHLVSSAGAYPGIQFTGFVDDIRPHMAAADVAVIPLRVGGETRIKAFEAIAMGRPVVSTLVGVEGLGLEPGTHFLAADTAQLFADAVLRLLGNAGLRQQIADSSYAFIKEKCTWTGVARNFEEICLSALAEKRAPALHT